MIKYFKGFNGLRFLAAFLVVLSHAILSIKKQNIKLDPFFFENKIFHSGSEAVNFFFTLSGFLITYLLIKEYKQQDKISIKQFYKRRIYRIWPLYFLIICIGFIGLGVFYPLVFDGNKYFEFSETTSVVLLFVFFLPNLATTIYKMGVLNPLWSIGVEEQFYLFWAPLFKLFKGKILVSALIILILSFVIFLASSSGYFSYETSKFLSTLRFHYMAIGAMFAYGVVYFNLYKAIINSKISRFLIPVIILIYLNYDLVLVNSFFTDLIVAVLYSILLINVSSVKKPWINLESKLISHLGIISYGIYMYHLLVDNCLRLICQSFEIDKFFYSSALFLVSYTLVLLLITIIIAHFSYKYFELYFINKKKHYKKLNKH